VWGASLASFFTDVSSEMVTGLIPLFLYGTLGVKANVIGLIEGVAATTASLVQVVSGRVSDRMRARKWLAVGGYAFSALAKPGFFWAGSWGVLAGVRWAERIGKGVRGPPRDALIADSVPPDRRGHAFGLHRAADTAGAVAGLAIAWGVITWVSPQAGAPDRSTFQLIVLLSLAPAAFGVLALALLTRDIVGGPPSAPARTLGLRDLPRPFFFFLAIVAVFDLGNSSDAFVILRAAERGLRLEEILAMLVAFNLAYAVVSTPAGRLSDRFGHRDLLIAGWLVYAAIYAGLALAETGAQVAALYVAYGLHHGLTAGAAKAIVAELVPGAQRASAFGVYAATIGMLDLPASLIAGVLWHGVGEWSGIGPAAPFWFGAGTAAVAVVALWRWRVREDPG
jgi:MFS family permease